MKTLQDKQGHYKELLITFVLIYFSNDTLLFGTNSNRVMFWIHIVVLVLLSAHLLFSVKRFKKSKIMIVLTFAFLNVITVLINSDISIKYLYEIMMLCIALLVADLIPFNRFKDCYCYVMDLICCCSIILFATAYVFPTLITKLPTILNESGLTYRFAIFGFIENVGYSIVPRVYGVFREPGVYMIFISVAMILAIFSSEKKSVKRIVLYIVSILITLSTAAYIVLSLMILLIVIQGLMNNTSKGTKRILLIMCATALIVVCFVNIVGLTRINAIVFNKLRVQNTSIDSRVGSIYVNIGMFLENPVLGNGFTYSENSFIKYAENYGFYKAHNTNTLLKLLSVHGLIHFIVVLIGLWNICKKNKKSTTVSLITLLVVCILLSNEDLVVNTMLYVFVAYGYFYSHDEQHSQSDTSDSIVHVTYSKNNSAFKSHL